MAFEYSLKKLLALTLALTLTGLAVLPQEVYAKRLGGGGSMGRQSSMAPVRTPRAPEGGMQKSPSQQQAAPAPSAPSQTPPSAPPARNRWLGPVAGLAAGLGIAALMSHLGMGGAMSGMLGNLIVIALVVLAGMWLFRKFRSQPSNTTAFGQPAFQSPDPVFSNTPAHVAQVNDDTVHTAFKTSPQAVSNDFGQAPHGAAVLPGLDETNAPWGLPMHLPAGFDAPGFLQAAKQIFVKLQALSDAADIAGLRELTSDGLLNELKAQIAQRGQEPNRTDVVTLEASLMGFETDATEHVASVHFSGMLREIEGMGAQPFEEIWNFTRPVNGQGGWLLSGIQNL